MNDSVLSRYLKSYIMVALLCICGFSSAHASYSWSDFSKAPNVAVLDMDSNTLLFERNVDEIVAPASISKLMLLYITFQHLKAGALKMNDMFIVSDNAATSGEPVAFLKAGDKVTVRELISAAIVASGNDACITIAEGLYGSEKDFVKEMNNVAAKMGLKNSNFVNVTGWPNLNSMSTRDIMTLSVRIFRDFPEYYGFFGEKTFSYNGKTRMNYNTLLNYNIRVDGLKTGHHTGQGYGMAASAEKDGRRIFVVVNGLITEAERAYEVKRLVLHALNHFETKSLFKSGTTVGYIEKVGKKNSLPVYVRNDVVVVYRKGAARKIRMFISHKNPVVPPIEKDQKVGDLIVDVGEDAEYRFPVYALEAVSARCRICSIVRSFFKSAPSN
ncbi:D-alanyl-D-alanine carboxypeptidase family protein [Anaplasma bovis]|uniref:D-alanyl-D-alanine carboxypeptidase family protein n=1 Tax=Anaplasma bovis TaxID=186733 RepID=UPI002FF13075